MPEYTRRDWNGQEVVIALGPDRPAAPRHLPNSTEPDHNLTAAPTGQVSGHARVDPAAVKAAHRPDRDGDCQVCEPFSLHPWPCEPYLLAVEVERLAGKVARVEAQCERMEHDFPEAEQVGHEVAHWFRLVLAENEQERQELRATLVDQLEQVQP